LRKQETELRIGELGKSGIRVDPNLFRFETVWRNPNGSTKRLQSRRGHHPASPIIKPGILLAPERISATEL